MNPPAVEVADILRAQGQRFLDRYRASFDFQQLKAFRALQNCRTAGLGGHLDACPQCGFQAISYNSCRNRPCPKCQAQASERWLATRAQELLPTSYFHVAWKLRRILSTSARRSVSSAFSTPGDRICSPIRISTASSRREASRPITAAGCILATPAFFFP